MKSSDTLVALRDEVESIVMWVMNLIFLRPRGLCRMLGLMSPNKFVHTLPSVRSNVAETTLHGHGRGTSLMHCGITDTAFLNSGRKYWPLCSTLRALSVQKKYMSPRFASFSNMGPHNVLAIVLGPRNNVMVTSFVLSGVTCCRRVINSRACLLANP